jgi:hypothetical protein
MTDEGGGYGFLIAIKTSEKYCCEHDRKHITKKEQSQGEDMFFELI